jgi:hypothetical protein
MANLAFHLLNKKKHDRSAFDCNEPVLNAFLQKHANQDYSPQGTGNYKSRTFVCGNPGFRRNVNPSSRHPPSTAYTDSPQTPHTQTASHT